LLPREARILFLCGHQLQPGNMVFCRFGSVFATVVISEASCDLCWCMTADLGNCLRCCKSTETVWLSECDDNCRMHHKEANTHLVKESLDSAFDIDCSTAACPDQCSCSLDKCTSEINACLAVDNCAKAQTCALACPCSDTACILKCAANSPSIKALPAAKCINSQCSSSTMSGSLEGRSCDCSCHNGGDHTGKYLFKPDGDGCTAKCTPKEEGQGCIRHVYTSCCVSETMV